METTVPAAGAKSSEFIAAVLTSLGLPALHVPDQYLPYITAIVAVYMACRTALKIAHQMGFAKNVPDLPAFPGLGSTTTVTSPGPSVVEVSTPEVPK